MTDALNSADLLRIVRDKMDALVLFSGTWCPDCMAFKPIWEKWTKGKTGPVFTVDTPRGGTEWNDWDIDEIPTVAAYSGGHEVGRVHGAISKDDLDRLWKMVKKK